MYLTDKDIDVRLHEHICYALDIYDKDWFVICLQGSQNYGMADENSDIDSKLLLIPSLDDLVFNKRAVSHTIEMPDNQEHIDCKDIREYFKIFRKSNINFVEILFTDYWIVNHRYYDLWAELCMNAEKLARINPYAAVKCMQGMALEKRHALCHEYPSRMEYIEEFGYDPKQLSHLARINYFIKWYTENKPYKECIYPTSEYIRNWLLCGKRNGWGLTKEEAQERADQFVENINEFANGYIKYNKNEMDKEADEILDKILYEVITRSLKEQLNE